MMAIKLEKRINQRLSLCSLQWDYNRELARLGNLKPLPDSTENLYMAVHQRRQADLVSYKKDTWVMDEDGRFSGNLVQDATEIGAKGKGL